MPSRYSRLFKAMDFCYERSRKGLDSVVVTVKHHCKQKKL